MKISLKELNQGFNALSKLANHQFKKDRHKLAYNLSRKFKTAKAEIEEMQASLRDLICSCGITPGQQITEIDPKLWDDYQAAERVFLRDTKAELWGDPIFLKEVLDLEVLTPAELADLDWLFIDDFGDQGLTEEDKSGEVRA